jgi:PKD repeat protein
MSPNLAQIPPQAVILQAKLSLYFDPNGSFPEHNGANASYIKRVTSDWDVMTVCWLTQPATTDSGKIDLPQTTDPHQDFTDIDVKQFVTKWVADSSSNYGMLIGLYSQDPYASLVLSSSNGSIPSKRPKLVITYFICAPPAAGFTSNGNGLTVNFTNTSTPSQSWQWNFGDGSTSSTKNPVHTYTTPGKYNVCLTAEDTCGSITFCDSIVVNCIPLIIKWGCSSNKTTVDFFDSTTNAISWLWDFGDGYSSVLKNPIHQFNSAKKYYVCLTVHDSCSFGTQCDTVRILSNGLPETIQSDIIFYPDPVNNYMIIHRDIIAQRKVKVSIFNIQGEVVYSDCFFLNPNQTDERIDLGFMKPGLYVISLISGDYLKLSKFVKFE